MDEEKDVYITVVMTEDDERRLDRLSEKCGKGRTEVVAEALKYYEDMLEVADIWNEIPN